MERHNNVRKYEQYTKIVSWLYVIAGAAIILLPFIQTSHGVNFLGYESPYTYAFAALAVVGLVLFFITYFKNDAASDETQAKNFNLLYPIIVTIIAVVIFLVAGKFFADAYNQSGKQDTLSVAVSGRPTQLAFWWGPFVYIICMAGASYLTYELNKIIDELRKGQQ